MTIKTIVLTGAPCAGKTKLLNAAVDYFREQSIRFFTIQETATELLSYGFSRDDPFSFQQAVFDYQLLKEDFCLHSISKYMNSNTSDDSTYVLVLDRALADGKAYLKNTLWQMLLNSRQTTESQILQRYDAVIYLESCVALDKGLYQKESNQFRSETNSEAFELEARTRLCYSDHKNLYFIPAKEDFEEKKLCFINALNKILTT